MKLWTSLTLKRFLFLPEENADVLDAVLRETRRVRDRTHGKVDLKRRLTQQHFHAASGGDRSGCVSAETNIPLRKDPYHFRKILKIFLYGYS